MSFQGSKKQIHLLGLLSLVFVLFSGGLGLFGQDKSKESNKRRIQYLNQLYVTLLPDDYRIHPTALAPTPEDSTWTDWQKRSGELPPDFKSMPSLPFLPDPLIIDEGGANIPVKTIEDWNTKRQWIKEQAQYWITGTMPPSPTNLKWTVLNERKVDGLMEKDVLLEFGPDHSASLHLTLLYPPGEGPFPVFMCSWKKDRYDWVQAGVRRGYIGVRFTATDPKYGFTDDSQEYEKIWWPEYDFSAINRWAWAASRAIDYLYTLPEINKDQIGLAGFSRNGKMALWAAAYDERIKAVVPISAGTGGENPFRYTSDKYRNETIELLTRVRPHWLHPRLRFYVGRESKLPVDMNSLMALVAPRGLMLTSSIIESAGNHFGIEQAYYSAKKAYDFLGAGDQIAVDLRYGLHAPANRDMERYFDFFDYVFKRGSMKPKNELFHTYSFSKWVRLSNEFIDPLDFRPNESDDLLKDKNAKPIKSSEDWEKKKKDIAQQLEWVMGKEPPSLGPGIQTDYLRETLKEPMLESTIGSQDISFGTLYYPINAEGKPKDDHLPVVIYLHEFSYSAGFSKSKEIIEQFTNSGFAVYTYDPIGFGTRIEEGTLFYDRFAKWSKLGRMVADVRWAIDELSAIEFLDKNKIMVVGYALGGTVALYSGALDPRISGVVSVSGFTPMRSDTTGKTAEGIYHYSHLHGLLPRLGFVVGVETRIP